MMDLLTFVGLNLLGVISPGPDYAIVTRFGLTGSRKDALFATLGITCALFIHVSYCLSGALFLRNSPLFLGAIRCLGALYLGYLGYITLFQPDKGEPTPKLNFSHRAFVSAFFQEVSALL